VAVPPSDASADRVSGALPTRPPFTLKLPVGGDRSDPPLLPLCLPPRGDGDKPVSSGALNGETVSMSLVEYRVMIKSVRSAASDSDATRPSPVVSRGEGALPPAFVSESDNTRECAPALAPSAVVEALSASVPAPCCAAAVAELARLRRMDLMFVVGWLICRTSSEVVGGVLRQFAVTAAPPVPTPPSVLQPVSQPVLPLTPLRLLLCVL
jgi:hypothetical protein